MKNFDWTTKLLDIDVDELLSDELETQEQKLQRFVDAPDTILLGEKGTAVIPEVNSSKESKIL